MPCKKDFVIGRNIHKTLAGIYINKKDSFLQTSTSCTLFSSQSILLCKLNSQSFAVYTQSGVFFLVDLEHTMFHTHHQNTKLILAPLGVSHTELYEFLVCDINSKECMIHRRPNCPENTELFESKLYELIGDYDNETQIEFSHWTRKARANLISCRENVPQFATLVVQKLLKVYSFVVQDEVQ